MQSHKEKLVLTIFRHLEANSGLNSYGNGDACDPACVGIVRMEVIENDGQVCGSECLAGRCLSIVQYYLVVVNDSILLIEFWRIPSYRD